MVIVRICEGCIVGLSEHHNIKYYVSASIDNISYAYCDNRCIDCSHNPKAAHTYSAVNNQDCVVAVPVDVAPARDSLGGCMLHVAVLPGQGCSVEFLHLGKRGNTAWTFPSGESIAIRCHDTCKTPLFRYMCATFTATFSATFSATLPDTCSDTSTDTDTDTFTYTFGDTSSDTLGDTFGDTFSATFSAGVRHLYRHLHSRPRLVLKSSLFALSRRTNTDGRSGVFTIEAASAYVK